MCVCVWTGRDLYAKFSIRSEHNVATHHVWQMVPRYRSIRRWTGGNHVSYASCARSEADCLALAAIRLNWTRTTTFYSLAVTILRFSNNNKQKYKNTGIEQWTRKLFHFFSASLPSCQNVDRILFCFFVFVRVQWCVCVCVKRICACIHGLYDEHNVVFVCVCWMNRIHNTKRWREQTSAI